MTKFIRLGGSGELILAVVLLVAALVVDFMWYRPKQQEYRTLLSQKYKVEEELHRSRRDMAQSRVEVNYVTRDTTGDLAGGYRTQDPVLLLEGIRKKSGLIGEDLTLAKRFNDDELTRTSYAMSVNGSYLKQVRFMKSLEQASPLVKVEEFSVISRPGDKEVTLKLDVSVLTLSEGDR